MWDFLTALLSEYPLWLMFASAFLSATVLPGNSEIVFTGLILADKYAFSLNLPLLLSVAIIGNSLGSFTTYVLGRWLPSAEFSTINEQNKDHPNKKLRWVLAKFSQYGEIALFLSWLPIVGDLFCAAAGWLRLNWWRSLIWITLGKAVRYLGLYFLIV